VTLPNFIIIGAAKAGTTALYWYLAEHPDVFMSPVKEANYFAYGRDAAGQLIYGDPAVHYFPVTSLDEYEQLFTGAAGAVAIGEASPIYLECPQSAGRIRELIPDARILCSIRHPVDRAYSNYLMHLRRGGQRLDPERDLNAGAAWAHPNSHWMRIGKYHEQLSRYFEAFPGQQIRVSLFEDLTHNPPAFMRDVYRFVNVEPEFTPDFATPHAPGGMPASRWLEGLFGSATLRSAVEPWVPKGAANWVRRLRTLNMRKAPPLPPALRQELTGHFRDDIAATSELIGRSLQHWL
jgi:sulfotransferase family protein